MPHGYGRIFPPTPLCVRNKRSPKTLGSASSSTGSRKPPNSAKRAKADYQGQRRDLIEAIATQNEGVTFRTPRLGAEGCCGRGCNGCQYFWHDPRYARAREVLRSKKLGALLSDEEARQAKTGEYQPA